ncbi:MAG: dephospho-CoA kinase [Bradyrhizobiaceae bacterium]|nr:MAG: dephospho-CoA kinase [Bradyrhizobiaceae bacterium]
MFVLGLTGSIGMGKSTTAKLFMEAGVPVYDADATVHALYEGEATAAIEAAFPGTSVDGRVDRQKLSTHVVNNHTAMEKLEAIVHPMLRAHEQAFLTEAEASGAPVVALDIPLLYETGADGRVDAVAVVTTTPEIQHERILARPTMTPDKLATVLARQMPDEEKRRRADFIVDTSHGLDAVRRTIREILGEVATMPKRRR